MNDTLTVLLYRKSRNAVSYYIGYEVSVFFVVGPFPSIYFGNAVQCIFSRGHATLHLAVSVGRSVGRSVRPSVRHIFEFRAFLALLLLPNRPRLDCRVSGIVFFPNPIQIKSVFVVGPFIMNWSANPKEE